MSKFIIDDGKALKDFFKVASPKSPVALEFTNSLVRLSTNIKKIDPIKEANLLTRTLSGKGDFEGLYSIEYISDIKKEIQLLGNEITANVDDDNLTFSSGDDSFSVNVTQEEIPCMDFMNVSNEQSRKYILKPGFFKQWENFSLSGSVDCKRFFMCGVAIDNINKCMVSTDGRRLTFAKLENLDIDVRHGDDTVIDKIPSCASFVKKVFNIKENINVEFVSYSNVESLSAIAIFSDDNGGYRLFIKIAGFQYPQWKRAVPDSLDSDVFEIDSNDFESCYKKLNVTVDKTSRRVMVHGNRISVVEGTESEGNLVEGYSCCLKSKITEDDFKACFNLDYLHDAIGLSDKATFQYQKGQPMKACVINAGIYSVVVMPTLI